MDGMYLRAKFSCAQFQHPQANASQHQDLFSQLQCLEDSNLSFLWWESMFNKKIEHKTCWPFCRVHRVITRLETYLSLGGGPSICESVIYYSLIIHRKYYGKNVSLLGREIILDNFLFSFKPPDSNAQNSRVFQNSAVSAIVGSWNDAARLDFQMHIARRFHWVWASGPGRASWCCTLELKCNEAADYCWVLLTIHKRLSDLN